MKEKIIIALDFDNFKKAKEVVDNVKDGVFYKVGLQSFLSFGERIINYLNSKNKKLFLDLKFKDIPNTVEGAIKSTMKYKPDFLTLHTTGGAEMIKRAVWAVNDTNIKILGVTVLTSLDSSDLTEQGISVSVEDSVLRLCEIGLNNGLTHFVCSPKEIKIIKERFGKDIKLITPGIRPDWSVSGDQKRVFTPKEASETGTDYMVIGRPITKNKNPNEAFKRILKEL
jgi:orotidine-5'-phosphate decarboxylase